MSFEQINCFYTYFIEFFTFPLLRYYLREQSNSYFMDYFFWSIFSSAICYDLIYGKLNISRVINWTTFCFRYLYRTPPVNFHFHWWSSLSTFCPVSLPSKHMVDIVQIHVCHNDLALFYKIKILPAISMKICFFMLKIFIDLKKVQL